MVSLLDNPATIEDHQPVSPPNGAETMCDNERRAPDQQSAQRVLDEPLALGIEAAGCLVEDEDEGVL
jgi:hypothetical protein